MDTNQSIYIRDYEDLRFVAVNSLFGSPLFGWWIFFVENYNPADVEGLLMVCPFSYSGPFADRYAAIASISETVTDLINS